MLELTEDTLEELVSKNDKVIVQYSAGWCGNCRIMKPKFKRLSAEFTDAVFVVVDAEKYPNSRKLAQVNNLPTFAAFEQGILKGQVQTNKEDQLRQLINEVTSN